MSLDEVEENVRTNGSVLTDGNTQLAALYYVDPRRFAADTTTLDLISRVFGPRGRGEHDGRASDSDHAARPPEYADDIVPVPQDAEVSAVDARRRLCQGAGRRRSRAISPRRSAASELAEGDVLRLGIIQKGEKATDRPRQPLSRHDAIVLTVAVDDNGQFVPGSEPPDARRDRHRLRRQCRRRSPIGQRPAARL